MCGFSGEVYRHREASQGYLDDQARAGLLYLICTDALRGEIVNFICNYLLKTDYFAVLIEGEIRLNITHFDGFYHVI